MNQHQGTDETPGSDPGQNSPSAVDQTVSGRRKATGRSATSRARQVRAILAVAVGVLLAVSGAFFITGLGPSAAGPGQDPSPSFSAAPTVESPFAAAPGAVPVHKSFPSTVAPGRVVLPEIGIDQAVRDLATDQNNVLYPPTDAAGWYIKSAPVGAVAGSTVIAGHINTETGGPGPFARLAEVKAGDPVSVTAADGSRTDWRIVSSQNFPKDAVPAEFFDPAGVRQLVLITCGGPVTGTVPGTNLPTYDMNTVAVAVPADDAVQGGGDAK